MKAILTTLATAACALLVAIPATAANQPAAKTGKATTKTAVRSVWRPETLSGKIAMVDPARKLVVVTAPDGTPFDMVLTSKTRIKSGDQAITLNQLSGDKDQSVSVRFTPERRGDVARSIRIGG
jgi:hypothetical protein